MTILGKRNYKRLGGAVSVGFAGLLLASVAVAGYGDRGGWNDDDKSGWNDDDDNKGGKKGSKDGWRDDDDDKGGKKGSKKGNQKEPSFDDKGQSLEAEVEVRGLKNKGRVRADLEATAEVEIECRHRGKGNSKKKNFEKEIDIELEGREFFSDKKIRNGRLDFDIETESARRALDDKYGHDGGCPGGYDRRIKRVAFLDAKLEVEQGNRDVVTWLCTFDKKTRDGDVPRRDVDCHRL